jgi:hypothetical protein
MYLRLTPKILHFLPDKEAPNFYEIHPWEKMQEAGSKVQINDAKLGKKMGVRV